MSSLLPHSAPNPRAFDQPGGSIDTTLMLEELKREFQKTGGAALEVDFRRLVSWVKLGDQLTHQVHPYPAKLLPHIAAFFVQSSRLTKAGSVLDPFCGSGTVAVEGSVAGLVPYVADSNPMALLLTRVKTTPYSVDALVHETTEVLRRAKRYRTAPQIPIVNEKIWYRAPTKQNLERILRSIDETEDDSVRDFFKVCFSATARRLSYADPGISVPVRLKVKSSLPTAAQSKIRDRLAWLNIADEFEEFAQICLLNIERVRKTTDAMPARVQAIHVANDARTLTNSGHSAVRDGFPLILTSPPYGSAQKYVRATSLSLNWLGLASPGQLSSLEAKTIGREHLPVHAPALNEKLPAEFERFVRSLENVNSRRAAITRTYLCELAHSLSQIAHSTAPGGTVVIVIGNNSVCGKPLKTDSFIADEMQRLGLRHELSLTDRIKSRGLLTKRSATAAVIARESVLVFRKP
jgi:hypothetical protein